MVATSLTSCEISRMIVPLSFTRGVTCNMTPVSRSSILLTIGAPGDVTLCDCWVTIGTWSPTCRVAGSLLRVSILGADNTLTLVFDCKVLSTAEAEEPITETENPGKLDDGVPLFVPVLVIVLVPLEPERNIEKSTPKRRSSLRVTSASVASISTCATG